MRRIWMALIVAGVVGVGLPIALGGQSVFLGVLPSNCSNGQIAASNGANGWSCTTPSSVTIGDTQIAYATAANTLGGDAGLTYNGTTNILSVETISAFAAGTLTVAGAEGFAAAGSVTVQSATGGGGAELRGRDNGAFSGPTVEVVGATGIADGYVVVTGDVELRSLGSGDAVFRTDTTTGHTLLLKAYDFDGVTYRTFATLTNGDVPSFAIAPPAGGTVALQGVFSANDGTAGLTQTCAAAVTAVTVKNGLITAITCP